MADPFSGKIALITGGTSGFGLATARVLKARGVCVVICARDADRLAKSGADLGLICDVANRAQVDRLVRQTVDRFGRIDILINNAGSGLLAPVARVPMADAKSLFDTNFFGALNVTQAVIPLFQRQQSGHIVMMSSIAGLHGVPNSSIYSASKAAMMALGDALRLELHHCNVHVTIICPGRAKDTGFFANTKKVGVTEVVRAPDTLTSDQVAAAVLHAIAHKCRDIIVPSKLRWFYLFDRLFPGTVDKVFAKRMPSHAHTT